MKLYPIIFWFFILFILSACGDKKNLNDTDTWASLYQPPQSFPLKVDNGYSVNPWTGEVIEPLVDENGDTLTTGQAILIDGKILEGKSKVEKAEILAKVPAHPNVHPISKEPEIVHIDKNDLNVIPLGQGDATAILLNSNGDMVPTGIPIPVETKQVTVQFPTPTKAFPARRKDVTNHDIKILSTEQGMSSTDVFTIMEDSKGHIWYGTYNNGLSKYDGRSFFHFTTANGLPSNRVRSLLEDSKGNIWIGTETGGGITKYDGNTFTTFTEKGGRIEKSVFSIAEDENGHIWFGTWGHGLFKYNGKTFTIYSKKEGLSGTDITSLYKDKSGNLWMGTWGKGINKFDGKAFTHFRSSDGISDEKIRAITQDHLGNLWFGTAGGGVVKYDGEITKNEKASFTNFTKKNGLSHNVVRAIVEDENNHLWFGTNGGGINKYDGATFTRYTSEEGLVGNRVFSIAKGQNNTLWIANFTNGISIHNVDGFTHIHESASTTSAIITDHQNRLWLGSEKGIYKYDRENLQTLDFNRSWINEKIRCLIKDSSGNLWAGTTSRAGVKINVPNMLDADNDIYYTTYEQLKSFPARAILEDKHGNIWMGFNGAGIVKLQKSTTTQPEKFIHYTVETGFTTKKIFAIHEDKGGTIWFGTWGYGICKYEPSGMDSLARFTFFTEKEGLPNNYIWTIDEDVYGNLWIGTNGGGVCLFDGQKFTRYTTQQGLAHNNIKSISGDKNGNHWIGTENGLNLFAQSEKENLINQKSPPKISTFNQFDGLKGLFFHPNSVYIDSQNRAWWGNSGGVATLDLNTFHISETAPLVELTHLNINEEIIDFRNLKNKNKDKYYFQNVLPFNNIPINPKFKSDKNHLTFHFVAIKCDAPHKIKYCHKVEGLSEKWSIPSNEKTADYRNLPAGKFTFKIRAIGESNEWSEPLEYPFEILPPWWQTWWAIMGYAILAFSGLVAIVKWRTFQLKQRQKELEVEIFNATRDIVAEKKKSDELLLNILPAEVAQELKEKGKSAARTYDRVTIIFTDFKSFTKLSEQISPEEIVTEINICFEVFDNIIGKYGIEKIKTIGDSYMAAGNLPAPISNPERKAVLAALEMQKFISHRKTERNNKGLWAFEMRIGIHTGPVVAGIVGIKKFQYDLWGDTVNTASRMENQSEIGQVNISQDTYTTIKNDADFSFEKRGRIQVKGKGMMEMYFVYSP